MTLPMNATHNSHLSKSILLPPQDSDLPAYVRANGLLHLSVLKHAEHGYQREVHEEGTARLRFPRHHGGPLNVMMMNVAGGVAGGDCFSTKIAAKEDTELTVSTPSAERIYRSAGAAAKFDIQLDIEKRASLAWIPQETILFNGAKLDRRINVACKSSARLILAEMLVLGRRESGETFTSGEVRDHWDIRIDDRLVMAERLHLTSDVFAQGLRHGTFGTSHAFATVVMIEPNGMDKLEQHRQTLNAFGASDVETASTAYSGLFIMRLRSTKAGALRAFLDRFLAGIADASRNAGQHKQSEFMRGASACN
jgi:urease accessory protein